MKTVFLVCLVLAGYVQQMKAQNKEHLQVHVRQRVWTAMQTLLLCYFDMAFIYSDHVIGVFFEETMDPLEVLILSKCAVEIGAVVSTQFTDQGTCTKSKYVIMAERLLTCSGMADKFLKTLQSLSEFHGNTNAISGNLVESNPSLETNRPAMKATEDTHSDDCNSEQCGRFNDYTEDLGTGDDMDDKSGDRAEDFLGGVNKMRLDDSIRYQVATFTETEMSDSRRDKKKKEHETSWCSFRDIVEGAGRGILGGASGGYMGGGKIGGLFGSGVGLVAGGVAGCFYGGYHGGVIGGVIGGGVGGTVGRTIKGLNGALKGSVHGAVAGAIGGGALNGWTGAAKGGVVGAATGAVVGFTKEVGGDVIKGISVGGGVAGINWERVGEGLEYLAKELFIF